MPGEARREERIRGSPLWGFCRDCRAKVSDRHIRSLRPDRDPRAAIYWLGEPEDDADDASESAFPPQDDALPARAAEHSQLALFCSHRFPKPSARRPRFFSPFHRPPLPGTFPHANA